MKITLERLKKATKEFDKVCSKYAKCGAADSEPGYVFNDYARIVIETGEVALPGKEGWDLYYEAVPCGIAHRALTSSAKKVYELLAVAPASVTREYKDYYDL